MSTTEIINQKDDQAAIQAAILEKVLISGDLSKLTTVERVNYYIKTCQSLGLNHLTKPFEFITLNGKLTLYAKRDATDQLRKINNISLEITSREHCNDLYIVTARATTANGRYDESIGVVSVKNLYGDTLANALMKAETKAKRRVTLCLSGLGFLDETETETITQKNIKTEEEIKEEIMEKYKDTKMTEEEKKKLMNAEYKKNIENLKNK